MRTPSALARLVAAAVLAASTACVGAIKTSADSEQDPPAAGAAPLPCSDDTDCVLAAPTCCACPTYAVLTTDPVARACSNVDCEMPQCPDNVIARCNEDRRCELACAPRACEPTGTSCAYGFAVDKNGCLTCECAVPEPGGCTSSAQCTRTRADCCGCLQGGFDTAVLLGERMRFDDDLMCPADPACPGINTCTADEPTCVQGRCELVSPTLPVGACGRPDLPACPADTQCLVNVSDQANMHGVGICGPSL